MLNPLKISYTRTLCIIHLFFVTGCLSVNPEPLAPPLSGKIGITGTLGEYRWSRLHHGVDISTGGKIGLEVHTVDDGYVSRVLYHPNAFGYAVVINHPDGRISRYGHLSTFSDKILDCSCLNNLRDTVAKRDGFDVNLDENAIEVKKGEVIAFSGESGAGFPHLHFEYMEGDTWLDPLQYGLAVKDKNPPLLLSAELVPATGNTRINGKHKNLTIPLVIHSESNVQGKMVRIYDPDPHIQTSISGPVFVRLSGYDPSGNSRLAFASGELRQNGKNIFSFNLDRMNVAHHLSSAYLYDLMETKIGRATRYTHLFADHIPGFLPFFKSKNKGLVYPPSEGQESVRLEAEAADAIGNRSLVRIRLRKDNENYPPYVPAGYPVTVEKGGLIQSSDNLFRAYFPSRSLLTDQYFTLQTDSEHYTPPHGLKVRSRIYTIKPGQKNFIENYKVNLKTNIYRKSGLYLIPDGTSYAMPLNSDRTADGFEASVSQTGSFLLMQDNASPFWRRGKTVRTIYGRRRIYIYPSDIGSGVDFTTLDIKIDGKDVRWEYEGDRQAVEIFYPDFIYKKGQHFIKARFKDRAGNISSWLNRRYIISR